MIKKPYQSPEVVKITILKHHVICTSDTLNAGTGAKWSYEDADSDEGFVL